MYVKCPMEILIQRDAKGLYAKALRGEIANFTGVSHPCEEPLNPELVVNTDMETPQESAGKSWRSSRNWDRSLLAARLRRLAEALAGVDCPVGAKLDCSRSVYRLEQEQSCSRHSGHSAWPVRAKVDAQPRWGVHLLWRRLTSSFSSRREVRGWRPPSWPGTTLRKRPPPPSP